MKKMFVFIICLLFIDCAYAYKEYNIGDVVTYNKEEYYVIENSDNNTNFVTLLKNAPLTVDELYKYGTDENEHIFINEYTPNINNMEQVIFEYPDGTGGISFYTSETCGYRVEWCESSYQQKDTTIVGCTYDYNQSDIKKVLNNWIEGIEKDLVEVNGEKTRLMKVEELIDVFSFEIVEYYSSYTLRKTSETPNYMDTIDFWIDFSNYLYLSSNMSVNGATNSASYLYSGYKKVRPVIYLNKCALEDNECQVCPNGYNYKMEKVTKYDSYKIGDIVKYNDIDYKVVKDSNEYNSKVYLSALSDVFGKGSKVKFFSNDTCKDSSNNTGCVSKYQNSSLKNTVDTWVRYDLNEDDLKEVNNLKSRILTLDDLTSKLGYYYNGASIYAGYYITEETPDWFLGCIGNNTIWIDANVEDSNDYAHVLRNSEMMETRQVYTYANVMPIIYLKKNVLGNKTNYIFGEQVEYLGEKYYSIEDTDDTKDYVTLLKCGVIKNKLIDKCDIGGCYEEEIENPDGCLNEQNKVLDNQIVNVDNTLKNVSKILLVVSLSLIILGIVLVDIHYKKIKKSLESKDS